MISTPLLLAALIYPLTNPDEVPSPHAWRYLGLEQKGAQSHLRTRGCTSHSDAALCIVPMATWPTLSNLKVNFTEILLYSKHRLVQSYYAYFLINIYIYILIDYFFYYFDTFTNRKIKQTFCNCHVNRVGSLVVCLSICK